MTSIFGKIIKRELPAEIVYESEEVIAIKDKYPVAPVHLLIIPKKEYKDIQSIPSHEMEVLKEIVTVAQQLAEEFDVVEGYRLLTNNGAPAGQSIFHLHFHLIGGRRLGPMA
jgi:histidine triad (HIT) family protein